MERTHEFHTDVVSDTEIAGVLIDGDTGRMYEFENPENHGDYARYTDPASGEQIVHESVVNHTMCTFERVHLPADVWAELRAHYAENVDEVTDANAAEIENRPMEVARDAVL